jgi:hypothetical protein
MSVYGEWKSAVITIATDDDLSAEVDLGRDYEYLDIIIPTIDSSNISLYVSRNTGGTFYQLGDSTSYFEAATGGRADTLNLGGWQYVKIKTSAAQSANRTFTVRGWRV